MTISKALTILGLDKTYTSEDLKKAYRALMILTHPDSGNNHCYAYEASDVNAAYEYLLKHKVEGKQDKSKGDNKHKSVWDAPINNNAFTERDIYHEIEAQNGEIIGKAVIATGKYTWCKDEDFELFLLSIYNCSKKIVSENDEKTGRNRSGDIGLLGEISYLLAQQYVDTAMILSMLDNIGRDSDGLTMYRLKGMLEVTDYNIKLKDGEIVNPAGVSHHKLYVRNNNGIVGYVSFKDDRLYYGVIPLFERKTVQVKMKVQLVQNSKRNKTGFYDLDIVLKLLSEDKNHMMESISMQIEDVLERF